MVSLLIGALLLVTAALKAHGLWADPYSQESILLSPRLLVAVIEVEVVLGLWLLSGYAQRAAWLAALGFFALATMARTTNAAWSAASTLSTDCNARRMLDCLFFLRLRLAIKRPCSTLSSEGTALPTFPMGGV